MEENDRDKVSPGKTKRDNRNVAGGLIGLAIGLFIASSMTLLTSLWFVQFWALVPLVTIPIGWRFAGSLPKVSGLGVILLFISCFIGYRAPITVQNFRFSRIENLVASLPESQVLKVERRLYGTDVFPRSVSAYSIDTDPVDAVEFYRNAFTDRGWTIKEVSFYDDPKRATMDLSIPGRYRLGLSITDGEVRCSFTAWNLYYKPKPPETEEEKILREALERQKEGQKKTVIHRKDDQYKSTEE